MGHSRTAGGPFSPTLTPCSHHVPWGQQLGLTALLVRNLQGTRLEGVGVGTAVAQTLGVFQLCSGALSAFIILKFRELCGVSKWDKILIPCDVGPL